MITRTRKKNKEHKLSCKSYITFVIISDPTKNPITIKIPKWLRFPVMACLLGLVIWVVAMRSDVAVANKNQVVASQQLQENTYENSSKDEKITSQEEEIALKDMKLLELTNRFNEVQNQLMDVQSKKKDINTKLNSTEKTTETQPIGAIDIEFEDGGILGDAGFMNNVQAISTFSSMDYTPSYSLDFDQRADSLMVELENTTKLLAIEAETYNKLDEKVDEMIPYWEAYPSMLPVKNTRITSPFGWRKNPFGRRSSEFHRGVDLKARTGTSVYATGKGKVIFSGYDSVYGRLVIIDHGYGITTKYAHNSRLLVKKGDIVSRGDVVSKSGNTGRSSGPHVHYGVLINGEPKNPLNFIKK